jgi:protein arginine N-methyltransferase 1
MGDVLDEHLVYCSDPRRLARFEEALVCAVSGGDTVADIGCGFGILGLLCLKAGASHVWGIDRTPAIEIARETMSRCGMADRYTCLPESSFRVELPERVDILICDHVGYLGIDYGIVLTIADARRRFLKPGGKVLPKRIVLHAAAVQSPEGRKLAHGWDSEPVPAELRWLREYAVNEKYARSFEATELASAPAELGTIDLSEDSPDLLSFSAQLPVECAGELDGLAGWFACEIADGVWMTNSPLAADRINRPQAFLPFGEPLAVIAGDCLEVTVSVRHADSVISWTARVARTGQKARQSTWASTILDPRDRVPSAERVPHRSRAAEVRRAVLDLIDGHRSNAEIESAILRDHGDLYPTAEQVLGLVRAELNRSTR